MKIQSKEIEIGYFKNIIASPKISNHDELIKNLCNLILTDDSKFSDQSPNIYPKSYEFTAKVYSPDIPDKLIDDEQDLSELVHPMLRPSEKVKEPLDSVKSQTGYFSVEKVEDRFFKELSRIQASSQFSQASTFRLEETKSVALSIAKNVMASSGENLEVIRERLTNKIGREPTMEELAAKVYSLSLGVQLEIHLNTSEGLLPATSDTAKNRGKAAHKKLFGADAKVQVMSNNYSSTSVKGQSQKISLVFGRVLGRGSYNDAYLVTHLEEGKNFVARQLRNNQPYHHSSFQTWNNETAIHNYLMDRNVPGIVQIQAVYSSGPSNAIEAGLVLETCDGDLTNLEQRLDSTQLDHVMSQIFTTLQSLHESGFIHGDLKPANIFFVHDKDTDTYTTKMGDFGFVSPIGSQLLGPGTYIYMPLESFYKNQAVSPQVDVWSAAMIAYQLKYGNVNSGSYRIFPEPLSTQHNEVIDQLINVSDKLGQIVRSSSSLPEFLNKIRANFDSPGIAQSEYLANIEEGKELWNFDNVCNDIIYHHIRPQMESFINSVVATLDPANNDYDFIIEGLMKKTISLEEALLFFKSK